MAQPVARPLHEPLGEINFSHDGFSLKAASAADPRFWIRIEHAVGDPLVRITDFTPSSLPRESVAAALGRLLAQCGGPRRLVFVDILPTGPQGTRAGVELHERIAAIRSVLATLLRYGPGESVPVSLAEGSGKIHLTVEVPTDFDWDWLSQ